jgi:PAS domain S-box-containing protein
MVVFWGAEFLAFYNDAFSPLIGDDHPAALGRPACEGLARLWGWLGPLLEKVRASGDAASFRDLSFRIERQGNQEEIHVDLSCSVITDQAGGIGGLLCVATDTTAQVNAEQRSGFLLHLGDEFRRQTDPAEVAITAAAALGRQLGVSRGGYGLVDEAQGTVLVEREWTRGDAAKSLVGEVRGLDAFGSAATAELKAGHTLVVEDCHADPRTGGACTEAWDGTGCRSLIVAPLVRDGTLRAILYLHEPDPRRWSDAEIRLAEATAERSWEAHERARSEQALRESEERYRTLFDTMDEGYLLGEVILDAKGEADDILYLEANPAAIRMIGLDPGGKRLSEINKDFEPYWRDIWGQVARTGEGMRLQRYAEPLKSWFDFYVFKPASSGGESRRVAVVFQDATERRQTEAALRESEARFRHMADSAPALIWMTDAEGDVTFANMHHDHIFGRPAAELLGEAWNDVILPEDLGRFHAAFRDAFEARRTFRAEARVRDKHGRIRWLRCEGVPRLDDAHRFLGYTGCSIDISENKQAEAELRRLTETLEQRVAEEVADRSRAEEALRQAQKIEAMGQLTGGVAHDFNNLLTIIRSSTDLLRRPDLPAERQRRYIDAIAATVERAAKLTGQLLAFARRQALKPEVFDVTERIGAVADMLRTVVGARIRIEIDAPFRCCFAEADVSQFETALVNMAVNARDAMAGEGTLRIEARGVSRMPRIRGHEGGRGAFVAISVTDTGSGIRPDRLPHIFEPFFTTKEVGRGTGLGLSQVYGFAKQSGGDVAVDSVAGRGATFTLYLPWADRPADGVAAERRAEPLPAPDGQGFRVLVVEDNAEVGRFSTQVLQDLGYETTWAANGAEALDLLGNNTAHFDAVFTDVVMPGMSGIELGTEIRRRFPLLPVVLTSGYSHVLAEEGHHGFELLHKPYAAEALSNLLAKVMRQYRAS